MPLRFTIHVGPVHSWIEPKLPKGLYQSLKAELSWRHPNAAFFPKVQQGLWDGTLSLLQYRGQRFYTGLLERVCKFLRDSRVQYVLDDTRGAPLSAEGAMPNGVDLYDYQCDVVDAALKHTRGIIWAPPRSGKTVIASALISKADLYPAAYLCEKADLALQARDQLSKCLEDQPIGLLGVGRHNVERINIISLRTLLCAYAKVNGVLGESEWLAQLYPKLLARKCPGRGVPAKEQKILAEEAPDGDVREAAELVDTWESSKLVIGDEVHHIAADTYTLAMERLLNVRRVYGLTATPWREDGKDILCEGLVGPIIHHIRYSSLFDTGRLVRPSIFFFRSQSPRIRSREWTDHYREGVVKNVARNALIARAAQKFSSMGLATIVVITWREHGRALREFMPEAAILTGQEDPDFRRRTLDDMREGRQNLIISTVLHEGVDIPRLFAVIIACAGKSTIDVFQRLRVMTPFPGKHDCVVVDFLDTDYKLRRQSELRLDALSRSGDFSPEIVSWGGFEAAVDEMLLSSPGTPDLGDAQ